LIHQDQEIGITPRRRNSFQHSPVTIDFHGQAKPSSHPPDRQIPREYRADEKGSEEKRGIPSSQMFLLVTNHEFKVPLGTGESPSGQYDGGLGNSDHGGSVIL
jgi:hypothetical protein